jgi:hypothetical protein
MVRPPPLRPDEPGFWSDFAALVAAGRLRGEAAEDAIVDFITASEVGPQDHPRLRVEVREQVEAVVRADAQLCALLHAEVGQPRQPPEPPRTPEPSPVAPVETVAEPPAQQRPTQGGPPGGRSRRAPAPRNPPRDRAAPSRRSRARRERVEADGVDAFSAGQTRRRALTVAGIVGAIAVSAWAWTMLREKPCDRLAKKICLALSDCEQGAVRTSLAAPDIGDELCESTRIALDEALVGVDPAKTVPVFTRVMTEQLGLDPRGEKAGAAKGDGPKLLEPTTVVEGTSTLIDLFADDAHLLWTRQDPPGVFRVRNIGGTPEVLAEHLDATDVVATRDFVYWVSREPTGGTLWADKKRGEYEPMRIEVDGFSPVRAAFMGPELAFVDETTGDIMMAAVAGGDPRAIAHGGLPAPVEIAADEALVFWATTEGAISSAPRSGGETRVLAERQHAPASLASDSTHLYWIDRGQGTLARVPKQGGSVEALVTGRPGLWDLAIDDDRVYATDRDAGRLMSVAKVDAAITVLAEGLLQPTCVVIDGAAIYWEANGSIARLPKS